MKTTTLTQEIINNTKVALGMGVETKVTAREIRHELFNIDQQDQLFINDLTVREVRSLFFNIDQQDVLM